MEPSEEIRLQQRGFSGLVAHRTPSEPFICEDGQSMTLHFQTESVQSEMWSTDPVALVLSYTRTMLGFLLFNNSPKSISMIGLGGGSLPKWCYAHLPEAIIKVIEINQDVIAYRDMFYIPSDDARFEVVCADGADYVSETLDGPEVLLVDGYDHDGQPPQLCSQAFYDDCYRALDVDGVLVVNLCGWDNRVSIERIRRSFHQRGLVVLPENGTNVIVFAVKGDRLWLKDEGLDELLLRLGTPAERSPLMLCTF